MAKTKVNPNHIIIALPSLIHRIGGDNNAQAKQLAHHLGCELKRIRRSRNWQIIGERVGLVAFQSALETESESKFQYLISKLQQGLAQPNNQPESKAEQLERLIRQQPDITLSELMAITNCTLVEARMARETIEGF